MKPPNMQYALEMITSVEFHPVHCNLLTYSSSRGLIRISDMRQALRCDRSAKVCLLLDDTKSHQMLQECMHIMGLDILDSTTLFQARLPSLSNLFGSLLHDRRHQKPGFSNHRVHRHRDKGLQDQHTSLAQIVVVVLLDLVAPLVHREHHRYGFQNELWRIDTLSQSQRHLSPQSLQFVLLANDETPKTRGIHSEAEVTVRGSTIKEEVKRDLILGIVYQIGRYMRVGFYFLGT
ncbi:hypothetical protein K1719_014123 [Acacia pycnantha]|nr:hypothetical protein K1719_014123 [Acacia pycnantha]